MQFDEEVIQRANQELMKKLLKAVVEAGDDYAVRNKLVIQMLALADSLGYQVGIRIDAQEPEWPVVFVELSEAGQISFHLPQHTLPWDGHTNEEKLSRIRRYIAGV